MGGGGWEGREGGKFVSGIILGFWEWGISLNRYYMSSWVRFMVIKFKDLSFGFGVVYSIIKRRFVSI